MKDITELFCFVDDFCLLFEPKWKERLLQCRVIQRNRETRMSLSEVMTILIHFQSSPYKTFKEYYQDFVCVYLKDYFPNLLSYSRFIRLKSRCIIPLFVLFSRTKGECTGISYVDSTSLKVCRNQRIHQHKVFKGAAEKGKTSMGWFFGFKLHMVINHEGEIIDIAFTSGNTDDRTPLLSFGKKMFGKLFGDKGYISKELRELLYSVCDVQFFTKVRKNMKPIPMTSIDRALLKHRSLIETVFGRLKESTNLEHSRHRSKRNFMVNLFSSLVAYNLLPKKPQLGVLKLL